MRFLSLANTVIAVFIVSLGPFILMGQLPQLLSRLFPFTRGLNHAYWAPNVWALVTAADRLLLRCTSCFSSRREGHVLTCASSSPVAGRFGLEVAVNASGVASTSRGLVGDTVFAVIPNVKPIHTFMITVACQSVSVSILFFALCNLLTRLRAQIFLLKLWLAPTYKSFVAALTLCGYASFMFGWHVHEKAILLVLVPLRYCRTWHHQACSLLTKSLLLSLLAAENHAFFRTFVIASVAGVFSLFPLLFTPAGKSSAVSL